MLEATLNGLIEAPGGRGYVLAEPPGHKPPKATAIPAPQPKATATKASSAIVALAAENSRLRRKLAEQPKTPETPQRDELAFQLGDNMAKYARGVRFAKPQPVTFRKETT
jgi:hypothetical protein